MNQTPAAPTSRRLSPNATVAFAVALLVVSFNLRPALTALGPLSAELETVLGYTTGTIGLLAALPLAVMAVTSPLVSPAARRWGMDNVIAGGLLLLAIAIAIRSFVPGFGLWIGTVFIGVAIAVLNVMLPAVIKRSFPTRTSLLSGLFSTVLTAGAGIAAFVSIPLLNLAPDTATWGWRLATGIWAAFALVGLLIWLWQSAPERARLSMSDDDHPAAPMPAEEAVVKESTVSMWRSPLAWMVALAMGLQSAVFYLSVQWMPSIEMEAGFTDAEAGFHMLLFQIAGTVIGLAVTALMGERRDLRAFVVVLAAVMALAPVGMIFAPNLMVPFVMAIGGATGGAFVIVMAMISLRTRTESEASDLSGMAQSVGYAVAAVGPSLAGTLAGRAGTWEPVLWLVMALGIGWGIAAFIAAHDRYVSAESSVR